MNIQAYTKQMTFELKMMLLGALLLLLSLFYDYMIIDVFYRGAGPETYGAQNRHLLVSLYMFRVGAIVVMISICIRVVRGLRSLGK